MVLLQRINCDIDQIHLQVIEVKYTNTSLFSVDGRYKVDLETESDHEPNPN